MEKRVGRQGMLQSRGRMNALTVVRDRCARLPSGLRKLAKGEISKFDITFFAILLLDDPGTAHIQPHRHTHRIDGNFMLISLCNVNHIYISALLRRSAGAEER
jgi:hypothetical protein